LEIDLDGAADWCKLSPNTGFVVTNVFSGSSYCVVGTPAYGGLFTYWLYRQVAAKVRCS
jgi:hypothetical protein